MASIAPSSFLLLLLLLGPPSIMAKKIYIVLLKHHDRPSVYPTAHDWYSANLHSLSPSDSDSLLCAYTSACIGFVASLDASEADALRGSDSVFGVHEVEFNSGVWPKSKSFDDTGMPEIPTGWRVVCESGPDFSKALCNVKLTEDRSFYKGFHNEGKPAAASVKMAGEEEIKAQADVPIDEKGNVCNTNSETEESDEENEGQADNKKKGRLSSGMVVPALCLLSVASFCLIIAIKFRIAEVDGTLSEGSGEENEGWLLGMVAQAFRHLGAVAVRLIKATKIGINYGVFKLEIPLRALWGDGA